MAVLEFSMSAKRTATIVILLLLSSACNSGAPFIPVAGPFSGQLSHDSAAIGAFTLTYADGYLGGTGTLVPNGQTVTVAISAVVSGSSINGQMTNAAVGGGAFTGQFSERKHAYGDFDFTDTALQHKTTGTWTMDSTP